MDYSEQIQKEFNKKGISVWDRISIGGHEGVLMPKSTGAANTLIIKLDNGYNIGIVFNNKIKKLKEEKNQKRKNQRLKNTKRLKGCRRFL